MRRRVLQRPRDLRGEDVAGHAHHEQFSQAGIEDPFGRHPRVAAPEDGRVGALGAGQVAQRLPPEGGPARLAPEEPSIPLDQPRQRFIGGDAVVLRSRSHHTPLISWAAPVGSSPPSRKHFSWSAPRWYGDRIVLPGSFVVKASVSSAFEAVLDQRRLGLRRAGDSGR
jgi:hypothetical protein